MSPFFVPILPGTCFDRYRLCTDHPNGRSVADFVQAYNAGVLVTGPRIRKAHPVVTADQVAAWFTIVHNDMERDLGGPFDEDDGQRATALNS